MISKSAPHSLPVSATRTIVILFLGFLVLSPMIDASSAQSEEIDRDEAISIVTQSQLGGSMEGVRLFVYPELLTPGETISTWRSDVFVAPAFGWFIFVDRYPGANWEHPCWYFFVDATSGVVRRYDATTPPNLLMELIEITQGRDNPPPGVSEEHLERFSERLRQLPKPTGDRGPAYAFIISGGASQGSNHIRYWNDCAFIYRALVEYYGYPDENIRVCISDGTDPAADRSDNTNSPPDLDGDGDDDIEYPATLEYIDQVFGELAASLTAYDQLFIYTTDHGGQESGQDCYLNLWNNERLRDDQMAAYVDALPCETIICTFEQCYSGGMIDDLEGDGRVIATAADWDELSWAMPPDYIYDTFVYHWTCAVGWATPEGDPVDADTNDDGLVSMREAFLYAEANDFDDETPQYNSTPAELGDLLFLYGDLQGVYLAVDEVIIDDDNDGSSQGNGNGVIDYGETIELTVALHNMGSTDATLVAGVLSSPSAYVDVVASAGAYGYIPSGGTVANADPFVFSVSGDVPDGEPLDLQLGITEAPDQLPLGLSASAPSYAVTVNEVIDIYGDNDGQADPGELVFVSLKVNNHGGTASPFLSALLQGDDYCEAGAAPNPIQPIPAGGSVGVPGFEVQVSPDCPGIHSSIMTLEMNGADSYQATAEVPFMVGPWFDDVEIDLAWTLGASTDDATTGHWIRDDPIGTIYNSQQCQPEDDHTFDPAHICFVTGNGSVGGTAGENDVDNGTTTLLSPIYNMEGATSATLTYWRWYTNNLGNNPGEDYWDVDVTSDGVNWIHLEHTTESANSWTEHSFDLGAFVTLTSTVQLRFVAADIPPGSLVEAAVDDITVSIVRPPTADLADLVRPNATALRLGDFSPNPMNHSTSISFELPATGPVWVNVYDIGGRLVRDLLAGRRLEAGPQVLVWDGRNNAGRLAGAGTYYIRLRAADREDTGTITLLR